MDQPPPEPDDLDALVRNSALALLGAARSAIDAIEAIVATPGALPAMTRFIHSYLSVRASAPEGQVSDPDTDKATARDDGDGVHHIEVR